MKTPAKKPASLQRSKGRSRLAARRANAVQARGAVMTEYVIIVGCVAIATIGAFLLIGIALVSNFEARRDLILFPSP